MSFFQDSRNQGLAVIGPHRTPNKQVAGEVPQMGREANEIRTARVAAKVA